jgi:hypothetical protein
MAKGTTIHPRISVNKLAEFITAKATRQRQILRDQKFPQPYKGMYYKEATEAISTCLASNIENISIIDREILSLEQQSPEKIGTQRRIASNIDALETFQAMLDDIDFKGSTPSLGDHAPPHMNIQNIDVSVRPEILLSATGKSGAALIGPVKLHFSKTFPLDADAGGFVSAILQEYAKAYLANSGDAHGPLCYVIDIGSKLVHPGVKAIASRMKEISANCRNICAIWPTISQDD